ncbi:hypothetical protein OHB04_22855 [Streptomyces sp. NBC_01775]|uniref:hypothetical protein n=1 Tax=Streptomyces sp. NBC_01775 TaxID=2975939 RepID=UPI002DD7A4A2|nr:hypothetical protein [Streptomyces sp. NBC_01775]WSB78335.1 hypothetical protein OHB04_22855 [Streptomyces sp. NBC_01775]
MAERLTFVLTGRDDLSRTLNGAGDSAARLHRRIDSSMRASTATVTGFTRNADGSLRTLSARLDGAGDSATRMGGGLPGLSGRLGDVASSGTDAAASMGSKGGGLGGAMGGVAAVAGLSLLPALGALVPMLAGGGLAAGTLKLGLSGIPEALEASGKGSKEYHAALKKLPAPARDFAKSLVGLKGEFKGVGGEIQKAMLPGFTKAVKGAGPLVKILGKNMVDLGKTFGDIGAKAGKVFKSSGFQKDLQANLDLGKRFVGDMASGIGRLGRSLLSFGAASGPTLRSLSSGLRDMLGKGLPGMFDGLKRGIGGTSKFLDGLFGAVNKVLPAFGRLAGETAKAFGPLLGELMTSAGDRIAAVMDIIGGALRGLGPVFKDLTYGMKIVNTVSRLIGGAVKDTAVAIMEAFAPAGKSISKTAGPLRRLYGVVQRNKIGFMEFGRVAGNAFISFVSVLAQSVAPVIGIFKFIAETVLGLFGGILHGAAKAFGWVPGLGKKLRAADKSFAGFKDSVVGGLDKAQRKAKEFSDSVVPRLKAGQLKLSIKSWESQLKEAKRQLKDPNLTKDKRVALKAKIDDLEKKIKSARTQLNKTPSEHVAYLRAKIDNWQSQLTKAKAKLKTVPASKRSALKAEIKDIENKVKSAKKTIGGLTGGPPRALRAKNIVGSAVRSAKSAINGVKGGAPRPLRASNLVNGAVRAARNAIGSVHGRTVYINAVMRKIGSWSPFRDGGPVMAHFAGGGPVRGFPGGGPVRGPGSGTSDSILARVSNGEFVIRAKAVARYGMALFHALNQERIGLGSPQAGAAAASLPQPTRPAAGRPAVVATQSSVMHVQVDVQGAFDPLATAREIQKQLLMLKRTHGLNVNLGVS